MPRECRLHSGTVPIRYWARTVARDAAFRATAGAARSFAFGPTERFRLLTIHGVRRAPRLVLGKFTQIASEISSVSLFS